MPVLEQRSVFASRALQVTTALVIVNTTLWVVQEFLGRALWHSTLNWLTVAAITVLALILSRRARVDAAPVVRYYWQTVQIGASLFCAVAVLRALDVFTPASVVLHIVGGIILTWPLVGLPFKARTRELRIDLGTLLAAAGILIWHFVLAGLFTDPITLPHVFTAVVVLGAGLNGVYLFAKCVLAGVDSFARRGLYFIGGSALIGGLGSAIGFLVPLDVVTTPLVLVLPLAAYCAAVGARVQVVDTAAGARPRRAPRGYSLMPYAAVAAVDALVLYTAVFQGHSTLIVVVAVVLTGLVVVRQLIAFRQNDALLARIGKQENRFRLLVQNSTDVVTITEPSGRVKYISPAVRRVLGAEPGAMTGTNIVHRVHPDDRDLVAERVAYVVASPEATATYQMRLRHADASYRWFEVISIVLVDLDDFKIVNDTLGHATGDALLVHVAERMTASVRPTDTVARLGGDEFAILFEGLGGDAVERVLTRISAVLLEPHYQSVVSLPDGRITGAEALVRWQHPTDGLLGPGAFIETAERTGLILPLGGWVLRTACAAAANWPAGMSVSVNASPHQLRCAGFATEVAAALRDGGLHAHRLTVELTESTAVGGGATEDNLAELRAMGVRLSLDDFGTGASTLSLLASCPVDQIKLDRSFMPDPGSSAIATAVVQMAGAFGLEAVAEGVETPSQAEVVYALGYRRAQGFHFARPMPETDLIARMSSLEARR